MRVVLNTNAYGVGCLSRHKYALTVDALLAGKYELCVSNDILLEYQEIVARKLGRDSIGETVDILTGLSNVYLIDPRFTWNMIVDDPDDNKFVDCVFAANADFIVTEDTHFRLLDEIQFPRISVINNDTFHKILEE